MQPVARAKATGRSREACRLGHSDLETTQRHLDIEAMLTAGSRPGSDVYPLVVAWAGRLYLEDGHHKVTRAALRGEATVWARVLRRGGERCP